MTFKIKGCTDTTFQTPVDAAKPLIEAPPIVQYPAPRSFTGEGKPAAAIGSPFAVVGRDRISETGIDWWFARMNTSTFDPLIVAVTLWDPRSTAWGTYQAWMHPPTYQLAEAGSEYNLTNWRVRFSSIESTTAT